MTASLCVSNRRCKSFAVFTRLRVPILPLPSSKSSWIRSRVVKRASVGSQGVDSQTGSTMPERGYCAPELRAVRRVAFAMRRTFFVRQRPQVSTRTLLIGCPPVE